MAIATIAALAMVVSAQADPTSVNLGADLRSYYELASALSTGGRRVVVAPQLANRVAVVSFRNRPWAEARALIEKGLDVAIRPISETEWRIEESPEIADRKLRLYSAFLIEADAHYARIVSEYRRLSHGQYPPPLDRTKAMIEEQIRDTPPRQGAYEGSALFIATAPWPVIAALALMYGTASSDVADYKVSGPALYYVSKGGAIKRLVNGDLINAGDAYYWRNWQDLPEYVRGLAVAQVRNYEKDLVASQKLTDREKRAMLASYAQAVAIAHRLRFHPDRGSMFFEYSVLTDPGIDESVFKIPSDNASEGSILLSTSFLLKTVAVELDVNRNADSWATTFKEGSLSISFDTSPGWYDQSRIRALALPMDENFMKQVATRAEVADELTPRILETTEALGSEAGSTPFELRSGSDSIGEALVDYAHQSGIDVVAPVIPARDRRLGSGASRRSLADLMPWLANVKQDTQGRVRAWTLSFDKGAAVLRDEWGYLDDNYTMPSFAVLKLGRAAIRPNGGGRGIAYNDLLAYCRSVTPAENAQVARFDPPFGVPVAARIYPFVNFIEKMAPRDRQALFTTLAKAGKATINMNRMALQSKLTLIADLKRICELNPDANRAGGAFHHAIFHPQINNSVLTGTLYISATDIKNPDRLLHRLAFSLAAPTWSPPQAPTSMAIFVNAAKQSWIQPKAGGAAVYREEFGPVELPR